jgi:ribonuclease R
LSRKNKPDAAFVKDIQQILNLYPHGISASALSRKSKKDRPFVQFALNQLVKQNDAIKVSSKYFGNISNDNLVKGVFKRKYSGAGIVTGKTCNIHISRRQGYNLVDGDEVEVVKIINRRGIPTGRVRRLIKRRNTPVIGYYKSDSPKNRVYPLEPKISPPIRINENQPKSVLGKVVAVQLDRNRDIKAPPTGVIKQILGNRHEYGVQTEIFAAKFHLRDKMPAEVIRETELLVKQSFEKDISLRKNLVDLTTITVDPSDARDFDDALTLDLTPTGFQLGVHIADVSHYVPQNCMVDHEAFLRGTSVYLPERAIHMLPEVLATDVCSLKPGEDRMAVSVFIDFDVNGNILKGEILESIVHSDARLTYQDFLKAGDSNNSDNDEYTNEIKHLCVNLQRLCNLLIHRRIDRGVLDLDMPETNFSFDDEGKISGIHKKNRSIAEQTIEEFMIAANIVVAEFLDKYNVPHIRRVHDAPDPAEIADLKLALLQLGLNPPENPLNPNDVRSFLLSIDNSAIRSVASHQILRSMKRAVYSAKRSGHFGLALKHYTQFTSPIRRYPDLMVHRSVKTALNIHGYSVFSNEILEGKAKQLSESERRAQEAEWDAIKIEKIRFMQSRIGNVYPGTITHVMEFGAFVELDEPFVEGFIPVSKMDSFFRFNESQCTLISDDNSIILKPGTTVNIQVESADPDRGMLDFIVVQHL